MENATVQLTIQDGRIVLPTKALRDQWQRVKALVNISGDTIVVKRVFPPSQKFSGMMDEFQAAARQTKLSRKTVNVVIADVRRNLRKDRVISS